MPEKTMRDAINEALHQAMEQDDSVFVIGEDVAGCSGSAGDVGAVGGVFGVTEGIYHRWPDRCIDTPISESAIVGAAAGAALWEVAVTFDVVIDDRDAASALGEDCSHPPLVSVAAAHKKATK